jgi:hypothetical protein
MRPILDEVIEPDVVSTLRAQANARSVVEPDASSFGMSCRDFQPLAPPDPLWLTTFAPILISFAFRLVSGQSLIGSWSACVRRKLPRLQASA